MVLLAVASLTQPAHRVDIAMAAWERNPESFSLGAHPHPNSNAVYCKLADLTGSKLLVCEGDGRYRLTRAGKVRVAFLRTGVVKEPSPRTVCKRARVVDKQPPPVCTTAPPASVACVVTREGLDAVIALSRTEAFAKYKRGSVILRSDAEAYWAATAYNRDRLRSLLRCAANAKGMPLPRPVHAMLYWFHVWMRREWWHAAVNPGAMSHAPWPDGVATP